MTFACPRRAETGRAAEPPGDEWRAVEGHRICGYCGSLEPGEFLRLAEAGVELTPTDKGYKVYVEREKFYFQHLDVEGRRRFAELLEGGRLRLAFPGRFYVRPYFLADH